MKINWVRTVYANGRGWHVGNMVRWKDAYYLCFVEGTGHGTEDSQIRIARSPDLENWAFHVAMEPTCIDPKLLPIGDQLFLYAVRIDLSAESEGVGPSWQMVSSSKDGRTWSNPRRCYLMDHDFWQPTEFQGRYYVACDNVGHAPLGMHCAADLLTSEDGGHWTWVSEILHGSEEYYDPYRGENFRTPAPSETALHFFEDGRLLAITRARGLTAVLSVSEPPYDAWERRQSQESRCYGAAVAQVGDHIVVTGRSFDNEGRRATTDEFPEKGIKTGVFRYEEGDIRLHTLLPSGTDTGYAGLLPVGDREVLIAYYSAHEHAEPPGSNVYLASLLLED